MTSNEDIIAAVIVAGINKAMASRDAKIAALEQHVAALEVAAASPRDTKAAKPFVRFKGAWHDKSYGYDAGDAVTINGRLFVARLNSLRSQPGIDPVGWVEA